MLTQAGLGGVAVITELPQDVFACIRVPVACAAALTLLEKRLDNIQLPYFGLRFSHHNTSRLTACIEAAEAVKRNRQ